MKPKKTSRKTESANAGSLPRLVRKQRVGKYGLTGNSGLGVGGFFHISMPYDCNGRVFVWSKDFQGWERMTPKRAKLWKREIITCSKRGCKKPAVMVDHHFPYYHDHNLCKRHAS